MPRAFRAKGKRGRETISLSLWMGRNRKAFRAKGKRGRKTISLSLWRVLARLRRLANPTIATLRRTNSLSLWRVLAMDQVMGGVETVVGPWNDDDVEGLEFDDQCHDNSHDKDTGSQVQYSASSNSHYADHSQFAAIAGPSQRILDAMREEAPDDDGTLLAKSGGGLL